MYNYFTSSFSWMIFPSIHLNEQMIIIMMASTNSVIYIIITVLLTYVTTASQKTVTASPNYQLYFSLFYIFLKIEFSIMFETCILAIHNRQFLTLREILLKFPFMLEIHRLLGEETFYEILDNISYSKISKHQGMNIDFKAFYLFFEAGRIYKKGRENKTQKNIRIKPKMKSFNQSKLAKNNGQVKQNRVYEIVEHQHFEDVTNFLNCNRASQFYYYPYSNKTSLVLHCPFQKLSESSVNLIRDLHHEKLKFLHSFSVFHDIQKNIIEEYLYQFHFSQLKFHALWHKQGDKEVLFIKEGSIEVFSSNKQFLSHAIQGKCMIGFADSKDLVAKVISESVASYTSKEENINAILSKSNRTNLETAKENLPQRYFYSTAVASPIIHEDSSTLHMDRNFLDSLNKTMRLPTTMRKRVNFKSEAQLDFSQKKQKNLRLRKHFSNFYNQVFEQFSQKKARQIGLASLSQDKLILYQIKVLQKKSPKMDDINKKLRNIRLQKMQKCKQTISQNPHIKQLKNVGVSIL